MNNIRFISKPKRVVNEQQLRTYIDSSKKKNSEIFLKLLKTVIAPAYRTKNVLLMWGDDFRYSSSRGFCSAKN